MGRRDNILIVDDDETMSYVLKNVLIDEGYVVNCINNGSEALRIIKNNSFEVILLDLLLPGMDGLEVLRKVCQIDPSIIVIMMSGYGKIKNVVEAIRLGAYDWLEKPLEKDRVLITIRNAIERRCLLHDKEFLLAESRNHYQMVGISPAMKTIYQLIDKVASKDVTVLITGESGTGKEMVAHAIHLNSPRSTNPFVHVNCASVPDSLIESELFGHKKGAFTGALYDMKGKFQLADNGTLLLDEIGDLSAPAQAKVLRAIESGDIEMVGSQIPERVNLRLISATNKDLRQMITDGTFRADLFHRINVIEIFIPPLRDRIVDILPLTYHFLEIFCKENNVEKKKLTPSAEGILNAYSWPGKVRELRNLIERMVVLVDSINVEGYQVASLFHLSELQKDFSSSKSFHSVMGYFEKIFLLRALSENDWNIKKTAEIIELHRSVIYQKIKKFQLKKHSCNWDTWEI